MLTSPDGRSRIALIDVAARTADEAMRAAWRLQFGTSVPQWQSSLPVANQYGWTDGRAYSFRASPDSERQIAARAMRRGGRWAVRIEDLDRTAATRLVPDLRTIRDGFRPAGYVPESFAGRAAHPLDSVRIARLTDFVERSRQRLAIPGIALGVVDRGTTSFAGGFGVRQLGRAGKVDADTLFLIASNTKPLTTLMLAKLVDEGKFGWDTPVVDILPQFRLADAALTRRVLVKHLLCACTGLPYRNLDWEFAPPDSPATLALDILSRMTATGEFGATYSYSNPIAAAGGLVGGHAAYPAFELGRAYDAAMASRVFGPLGMTRTTFDFDRAMRGNYAHSYGVDPLGRLVAVEPVRERQMHAVRPAGGAWSNVNDLLAYVRLELAGGLLPDGRRHLSGEALRSRWARQIGTGPTSWYGMGLETRLVGGTPLLFHGGRLYGFRGDMIWLPEHGVGVVVLMNSSTANVLMDALPRKLLELLFDAEPEADSMVEAAAAADLDQRAASRRSLNVPAAPAHSALLASRYVNQQLGEIRVERRGGATLLNFGSWRTEVGSRANPDGTVGFVALTASPPFPFVIASSGERRTLTIRDAQNVYTFAPAD